MQDLPPIWILVTALGLFGVLVFLRLIASYLDRTLTTYDTAREALRLRRDYLAELERRQQAEDGNTVIDV